MNRHRITFGTTGTLAAVAAATAIFAGCASDAPVAQLATARESVLQAERAGAPQLAPAEMLSARDKLSRAEVASRDHHYDDAVKLTDEATADARLAESKSRAIKAQRAQQDLQQSNAVLSNEVTRPAQ